MLSHPEFRFLSFATRFENFVEHLDFPEHCIPLEFFDSILAGLHRQIGDQFPMDSLPMLRAPAFLSMDNSYCK